MIAKFFDPGIRPPFPDMDPLALEKPLREQGTWNIFYGVKRVQYPSVAFSTPSFDRWHNQEDPTAPPEHPVFAEADYFSGVYCAEKDPPFFMIALLEYADGSMDTVVFAHKLYLCNDKGKTVERIFVDDHIVSVPEQPGRNRLVEEGGQDIGNIMKELKAFKAQNAQ